MAEKILEIYQDQRRREPFTEWYMDFGPGYRVYFGEMGNTLILLYGGDKSTQGRDIKRAQGYWAEYKESKR